MSHFYKEIINKVRQQKRPAFRPTLSTLEGCSDELGKLISQAWDTDPNLRPDFPTIKLSMRKLNKLVFNDIWSCSYGLCFFIKMKAFFKGRKCNFKISTG